MINRRRFVAGSAVLGLASVTPALAAEDRKANKATAQRFIDEVWNGKNLGVLDEIVSPAYAPEQADAAPGIDALKQRVDSMLTTNGFMAENLVYEVDDIAADGPLVFLRGFANGTSSQGKAVKATFFLQLRFDGGLIISDWSLFDQSALLGI